MTKTCFDKKDYSELTPEECLTIMCDSIRDGKLILPDWTYDGDLENGKYVLSCEMAMPCDNDAILKEYHDLYDSLAAIAKKYDELMDNTEDVSSLLNDELMKVWNVYISPFDKADFDGDRISEISEKLDYIAMVIDEDGKEIDSEYEVSDDDIEYYNEYMDHLEADSERRLGSDIVAYPLVITAKRLCRLMSLKAPQIILNGEAKTLITALLLHRCAKSVTPVSAL